MGPRGRARSREAISRDLDRWIVSGWFRSSAQGANNMVADAAPSATVKQPELRQAWPPGGLGSLGLAELARRAPRTH
jgi:hypothetical protein